LQIDPIAERWEKEALCVLGLGQESGCSGDDLLEFTALFDVSFGEEFGRSAPGVSYKQNRAPLSIPRMNALFPSLACGVYWDVAFVGQRFKILKKCVWETWCYLDNVTFVNPRAAYCVRSGDTINVVPFCLAAQKSET
jgi:hypothetical protein